MMRMSSSKTSSYILAPSFLILLILSLKLSYCVIACPEIEKQSLLSFKQSLKDFSNSLSSWKAEVNCCEWRGVFCSNLTGHVHELHLQNDHYDSSSLQGLSGKINPSLLNLKHLEYLDLSHNHFKQEIPSFIGSLTSLKYLNFSGAGFYGKVPNTIGNLSNLHTLILDGGVASYSWDSKIDDNNLELEEVTFDESLLHVDSLEWLSGLCKLEHLNMNFANLNKATRPEQVINKLPSLVELHLRFCSLNDFSADPWNGIVNISHSNLAIIDLSVNNLQSYTIPRWIFQLTNLIYVDLSSNSFEGPIPATIANTTKLKYIDLSGNEFNSTIPNWLYSCKNLEYVNLGNNYLHDRISDSIGNLTSLNTLDLTYNKLSGKIPRGIGKLCKMKLLFLGENDLEGEISDSFGNMSDCFLESMESLIFGGNKLSGHLTHQFGKFRSISDLDFSENSLSGVIPNNIGNLYFLEYLSLFGNNFTGNLPESMGQLFNLKELYISNNTLEGDVTETHFANLSKLNTLLASGNNLTFRADPNWIPPFKLKYLGLRSWNLGSGSSGFPPWLETPQNIITQLDLSCTGISGNVPGWIWNIRFLNLSHNQLHGNIPILRDPDWVTRYGLRYVTTEIEKYLSSNNFSGSLPRVGDLVTELDLSDNSLSGDISHFLCDPARETYRLRILHLGGNLLSGELPDCWMNWPSLKVLNLGNNNFSGPIPNSIRFLSDLRSLNLYGNRFSGRIPFSMQNCTQLVKLDLSDNAFDGSMPTWIGTNLSQLEFLILRSNRLSGDITSAICQLSSLKILDLSNNKFSGMIPRCVQNFTAMATKRSFHDEYNNFYGLSYSFYMGDFLESASVTTKGSELQYDTILPLFNLIDLSNNRLFGDIPKEITRLLGLKSLNLSRNRLIGRIPGSIGNMKQLESLDFSRNSLSGDIPSSFTSMTLLSYLNLSYNNLTGKIPESTQIQTLSNSSFVGNNLCGPPLTISCSKVVGPMHGEDQDEKGNNPEIEWLYVFISLGHAVGLSGFLTTLYFKKAWRDAYYEFFEDMWYTIHVYFYVKWTRFTRALGRNL